MKEEQSSSRAGVNSHFDTVFEEAHSASLNKACELPQKALRWCFWALPSTEAGELHPSPAHNHWLIIEKKKKRSLQACRQQFYKEKWRCGNRGSALLAVQATPISTIGNSSQPLPLCSTQAGTGRTRTKLVFFAASAIFFSLLPEEVTFRRLKSTSSQKPHDFNLQFYSQNRLPNYQHNQIAWAQRCLHSPSQLPIQQAFTTSPHIPHSLRMLCLVSLPHPVMSTGHFYH